MVNDPRKSKKSSTKLQDVTRYSKTFSVYVVTEVKFIFIDNNNFIGTLGIISVHKSINTKKRD